MVRYKRRSYGRSRRSTNVIKMKFQSFMDISTSDQSMQIITVSAGGSEILRRLAPQFGAYKYYKIGNIAVKLVPASTLPVDPTGLSYESGEQTVDPRDQLTPGMMRITNGEDVFEDLTQITDQFKLYNTMLLDSRWFKWMLQSGVKRHATPRYWQIGQLHQDKWPGAITNLPNVDASTGLPNGTAIFGEAGNKDNGSLITSREGFGSSPRGLFQVGHRGVLGWLPTDGLAHISRSSGSVEVPLIASPPEVEVMKIILPRAYKTKYYYRMFITETVYFREPIVNFGVDPNYNILPLDIFRRMIGPLPQSPGSDIVNSYPSDENTGGNYGDD